MHVWSQLLHISFIYITRKFHVACLHHMLYVWFQLFHVLNKAKKWEFSTRFMFDVHVAFLPQSLHVLRDLLHISILLIFNLNCCMFDLTYCMFDLSCCMFYIIFLYVNFKLHVYITCCMFDFNCFMSWIKPKNEDFLTCFMFNIHVACLTSVVQCFTWFIACLHCTRV